MLDLLYPRLCATCDRPGRLPLCRSCDAAAAWIDDACLRCAMPSCPGCDGRGVSFDAAASAGRYDGSVRDALIRFKLLGERRAAGAMAERMLAPLNRIDPPVGALVTYVPSGRASMRERGFNPAAALAVALALRSGRRAAPLLRKTKQTPDLAGLDRAGRKLALSGAFASPDPAPADVVLIDDVLTTGATASACAHALKRAGARRVTVVTFARAI